MPGAHASVWRPNPQWCTRREKPNKVPNRPRRIACASKGTVLGGPATKWLASGHRRSLAGVYQSRSTAWTGATAVQRTKRVIASSP